MWRSLYVAQPPRPLCVCAREQVYHPPPPPPMPRYDDLIEGLANYRRTWTLPGPMRLPDLVDVYQDIWDAMDY